MDKLSYFMVGNCDALGWNEPLFGANDSKNRFVGLHTNATNYAQASSREIYDPDISIESLKIRLWGISNCSNETILNRDFGRCLPSIKLNNYTAYSTNVNFDKDKDGLHDYVEDLLAETFVPIDDYWCGHKREGDAWDYIVAFFEGCNSDTLCYAERLCDEYSEIENWRDYLSPATIPEED